MGSSVAFVAECSTVAREIRVAVRRYSSRRCIGIEAHTRHIVRGTVAWVERIIAWANLRAWRPQILSCNSCYAHTDYGQNSTRVHILRFGRSTRRMLLCRLERNNLDLPIIYIYIYVRFTRIAESKSLMRTNDAIDYFLEIIPCILRETLMYIGRWRDREL